MYIKINNIWIKKIILFFIFLLNINISFAEETKINWVLFYEQCNILLEKSDVENISKLWENLCIFIENKNSDFTTILAKNKNDFWFELINQETLDYLKNNYYRWEKINVYFSWYKKYIAQNLKFNKNIIKKYDTLTNNYKIKFFDDTILNNYKILTQKCSFNSFYAKCNESKKQEIVEKITEILNLNKLSREKLLNSSYNQLILENNKIIKIKEKIKNLNKYYSQKEDKWKIKYSENIKFTINFLIYKLEIYNQILKNRISDLEFNDFLKENNIYFIDKKLIWDLYISQNNQFTFFYYKDKRINTLKNSLSHFDEDELKADPKISEKNIEYLKEKIRNKYSAEYIKNTDKKLILITKNYLSKQKYLLFDTQNNKIFNFYWKIKKVEKWKKWYYFLLENYKQEKYFTLYTWKILYIIIEPNKNFNLNNFELLERKRVKLFYSNSDKKENEKIIDVSEY
jgi:hypothetical protein